VARPNLLLTIAAVVFFTAALPLLFAPDELLRLVGAAPSTLALVLLQLLGSACFGFALLDWMSRRSRIDGIFGRPIVIANLGHTASAALLLGKIAAGAEHSGWLVAATILYGCLALAFGSRLFSSGPSTDPPS
jgi:hypothetical protein